MVAVVYAFGARERAPRPWQNHELSELYRVVDLLGKAGLAVETDMGLSDEGEPWFVFCRADNGDVVVHFARIDGQYVAASAVVEQSYRGANFRDIIDQLVRQQPLVMPRATNGASLFLHPAVVLTAFVATALFYAHRAEAADGAADPVQVSLQDGHHGENGHHGETGFLLKLLLADPVHADKVLSRTSGAAESGTPLASLMAIAIAAIAPLIDHSVELTMPSGSALAATQAQPVVVHAALDDAPVAAVPTVVSPHDAVTILDLAAPDAVSFDRGPVLTTASVTLTTPLPVASHTGDTAHSTAATAQFSGMTGLSDHIPFHSTIHAVVPATVDSSAVAVPSADASHHLTLSDLDPQAIQVFSLIREANSHGSPSSASSPASSSPAIIGGSPAETSGSGAPSSSSPGSSGTPAAESHPGTIPAGSTNTDINTSSPTDLLNVLNDFAYSGTHAVTGSMRPTDYLSMAVSAYERTVSGPIQLVVFDDPSVAFSIFALTKGVLFVSDSELGATAQTLHGTNTVTLTLANGDVMKLIGVITVDASHPLAG
ncbi:MAG: hypothetical protein F8N37_14315 [Telmatospirillum sp.]|nr:hypothetical protein [Telmatospirillum sp.]